MTKEPESKKAANELPAAKPVTLAGEIDYLPGSVVSRTLIKNKGGSLTLFAFDQGQGLSEHTAPFDAFVQVLDGVVELVIGGEKVLASAGETVRMPANVSHGLTAKERFKMLLSMVRE